MPYRLGSDEEIRELGRAVAYFDKVYQQSALRRCMKRALRHNGSYNKYDGKGNRVRDPFPSAANGGRPFYPYPLGPCEPREARVTLHPRKTGPGRRPACSLRKGHGVTPAPAQPEWLLRETGEWYDD